MMSSGMVTSPHPLASAAGAKVLERGGNAIEAAVAMGGVLTVVCPHFCGLGGDAVWMIADGAGNADCILGLGQAAAAVKASGPIPLRGPGSAITTAGAVAAWEKALDHSTRCWAGEITLGDLLTPAAELAAAGFPVTKAQAFWLDFRADEIGEWPGFSDLFKPGHVTPAPGDRFRQPQLATSLEAIMRGGAREFYEGDLAHRLAKEFGALGTPITHDDLAATQARDVKPLTVDYRGVTLHGPPPPTQGLATLMTMGILDQFDAGKWREETPAHFHHVIEAIKRAFLERDAIADPDFASLDTTRLLSREWLAEQTASIDPARALSWPHEYRTGDTVYFGAVDRLGNCASVLQSTYFDWGSGIVVGDTGIIWNNRGAAFSTDASHPNSLVPGKRPFHTLNPGLATRNGRPFLLYGTQGADGQPQTLALLLTRLIDFGLDPAEALKRPRFLLGKTFSDARDSLKIEVDAGEQTLKKLAALGHDLSRLPPQSPLAGQAGAIMIDNDTVSGAHDPRGEGCAIFSGGGRPGT